MHTKENIIKILLFVLTTTLLVSSCTSRPIKYGVVLWSTEEDRLPTGSVVPIFQESAINSTFTIGIPNENTMADISQWRIQSFRNKREAADAAKTYGPLRKILAIVEVDGLPVRSEATSSSTRVYKLKKGETIKILEKATEPSVEGPFTDFWYKVLTKNGTSGYCFGHSLILSENGKPVHIEEKPSPDSQIRTLLRSVWRPEYYRHMIENETIDLEKFRTGYGMFADLDENTVTITTEEHTVTYRFTDIQEIGNNRYLFQGTPLKMDLITASRMEIEYQVENESFAELFVTIDKDASEYIYQERLRRKELYALLTEKGEILRSTAYGTIQLKKNQTFHWENFQKLVPQIIPAGVTNEGDVEFRLFLPESLKTKYDGAVSFDFDGTGNTVYVNFLFKRENNGVKFVYVPKEDIEKNVIMKENPFPIIIFFTT